MVWIQLILILFFVLSTTCFDPDEDICNKPEVDGSVKAVDGNTYIFKGKYYWKTNSLDTSSGIVGYADLISNKWPEIESPIVAGFTLRKPKLMTVLVTEKNKWFAYEKGSDHMKGTTDNWPQYQGLSIDTMFSFEVTNMSEVFVIYDNSKKYLAYDFNQLEAPRVIHEGRTSIDKVKSYVLFIDEESDTPNDLKDLLPLMASIRYNKTLVFLGTNEKYCRIDLTKAALDKECKPESSIHSLFNCPLDLSLRPDTTTVNEKTTKPTDDSNTVVMSETNTSDNTIDSEEPNNSVNDSSSTELNSKDSSSITTVYILVVIVIVIIVVIVVVIILIIIFTNESKNSSAVKTENGADVQRKTDTDNDLTRNPSITSLKEASDRKVSTNSFVQPLHS